MGSHLNACGTHSPRPAPSSSVGLSRLSPMTTSVQERYRPAPCSSTLCAVRGRSIQSCWARRLFFRVGRLRFCSGCATTLAAWFVQSFSCFAVESRADLQKHIVLDLAGCRRLPPGLWDKRLPIALGLASRCPCGSTLGLSNHFLASLWNFSGALVT